MTGSAGVTVTDGSPAVVAPPTATPGAVTGTTVALSVRADDDAGEADLTYTWATVGTPPAPVTFAANGTNAAKDTLATFTQTGTYTIRVAIADAGGQTVVRTVAVTVTPTPTTARVDADPAAGRGRTFRVTVADQFGLPLASPPVPVWSLDPGSVGAVSPDGVYTPPARGGSATVRVTVAGLTAATTIATDPTAGPPAGFAVGADTGGPPEVRLYNADGSLRLAAPAFAPSVTGGVRTATGDFTGDGVPDAVAGTGPGVATRVRVLDGVTGAVVRDFAPFEAGFTGGVYVAASDLTGDGVPDVVVTPDEGGGPRVIVFDGRSGAVVADFFGIDDPGFRGGARAAVGDVNGDGRADLIVAAGFGGGPRLAGYDGRTLAAGRTKLFADMYVFEQTLRNGVYVAAADVDGDGHADLVAGGGPGGGPRVFALSGADLVAGLGGGSKVLANFFSGEPGGRGGARVAAVDLDGDATADLVAGAGTGAGSWIAGYRSSGMTAAAPPADAFAFDVFGAFAGGVFVG